MTLKTNIIHTAHRLSKSAGLSKPFRFSVVLIAKWHCFCSLSVIHNGGTV